MHEIGRTVREGGKEKKRRAEMSDFNLVGRGWRGRGGWRGLCSLTVYDDHHHHHPSSIIMHA